MKKKLVELFFMHRNSFRDWLKENHTQTEGIWMIFYKKHTKQKCIEYEAAVEEAICFGWIDSIVKKKDTDTYLRKFTPRSNYSNWSEINIERAKKMYKLGKIEPSGLNKIASYTQSKKITYIPEQKEKQIISPENKVCFQNKLKEKPTALINFKNLSESEQKKYLGWIFSAKKKQTKEKRILEAISRLKANKKLGLK